MYEEEKERECSVCFQALPECKCSIPHLEKNKMKDLIKITRYRPDNEHCPSAYLIYSLKQDYRRDVHRFLAEELSSVLRYHDIKDADLLFTNVPRRRASMIRYGYDHARILAKSVARILGATHCKTLVSKAKSAQKSLSDEERIDNAKFAAVKDLDLKGKTVVLIDDIVTTGASMGECARLLRAAGAKKIIGACLSVAYQDPYTPIVSENDYVRW